jgi:hypothetical protein
MEKIVVKKDEKKVLINFNTKFYPSEYIFKSVLDFSDSCWTSIDGSEEILQITLKPRSENIDLDTLGYEFYNYVFAIIRNSGRTMKH